MRDIKFRAFDNKEKKWLCGYEYPNLGGFSLYGEVMMMGEWAGILDSYLMSRGTHKPEDLIVMQYTGLKDKNGKEIYEGDITRVHNEYGQIISERVTEFKELIDEFEGFKIKIGMGFNINSDSASESEVIGNIYENPELLTK